VEHLKGASLGYAPVLLENIRQCWKSLPGTNAITYYEQWSTMVVKNFITLGPVLSKTFEGGYE